MTSFFQTLDFAFRVIVLLLAMTVGTLFVVLGARHALAASLKPAAVITGDMFTAGDLFTGLPRETAEKVLGPAPLPGHDMVLNVRTLMRVAAALNVPWQPSSTLDQIVVSRAATVVDAATIRTILIQGLQDKGAGESFDIVFAGGIAPQIILPHDQAAAAEIAVLNFDPNTGRFAATMIAPSRENPLSEIEVAGKIERLVQVPVLEKSVSAGDIINAADLTWVSMKTSDLQDGVILNAEDLAGMAPRRLLVSGKPVRGSEIERPQLVTRGDLITITYNDGPMLLTAQGKAMQDGAKGDMIRVVNTSSNRAIEAFVEDQYLVTVVP